MVSDAIVRATPALTEDTMTTKAKATKAPAKTAETAKANGAPKTDAVKTNGTGTTAKTAKTPTATNGDRRVIIGTPARKDTFRLVIQEHCKGATAISALAEACSKVPNVRGKIRDMLKRGLLTLAK
jgi:hypothetical protein